MKKDKTHSVKKLWITVWVIVVSAMILGIVSSAAYINRNSVKRVVSTQGGGGTAFSSNYMLLSSDGNYSTKNIYFTENAETTPFDITVCNYVQNDPSKVNNKRINYTLTLKLLDYDNADVTNSFDGLMVKYGSSTSTFSGGVCTISGQTLAENTVSVNKYTVTVPKEFVDTVMIKAEAVPEEDSKGAVNNNTLGRYFSFSYLNNTTITWTGSFVETTADNYDGFNYIIKGQGKGTVTLTWNTAMLEMNKLFLDNYTDKVTTADGKATLTLEVGSNNINRYDIQFYKVEGGVYDTMESVKNYVTFDFAKSQE